MPDDWDKTLSAPLPKGPRLILWSVSAVLSVFGLVFGLLSGVPWPSRTEFANLQRELTRFEQVDDAAALTAREHQLGIQGLQYEVRQLKEHQAWLEAELENLKRYVYPAPNTIIRPRSSSPSRPPNALGPPQHEYPGRP